MSTCVCVCMYVLHTSVFPSLYCLLGPMEQFNRAVWPIVGAINLQLATNNANNINNESKRISRTYNRTYIKLLKNSLALLRHMKKQKQ